MRKIVFVILSLVLSGSAAQTAPQIEIWGVAQHRLDLLQCISDVDDSAGTVAISRAVNYCFVDFQDDDFQLVREHMRRGAAQFPDGAIAQALPHLAELRIAFSVANSRAQATAQRAPLP